jgi:uncharacterized alpha-E superfamily protein
MSWLKADDENPTSLLQDVALAVARIAARLLRDHLAKIVSQVSGATVARPTPA